MKQASHTDNKLILLYRHFSKQSNASKTQLLSTINGDKNQLNTLLDKLSKMGLSFKCSKNSITLLNNITPLDSALLEKHFKKLYQKQVFIYFTTDSTNTQAKAYKKPSIHIADYQSTSYGRQGKVWLTPLGQSIAISLVHHFTMNLSKLSGLNIVIAVATINTIHQFSKIKSYLKWPNDIYGIYGKQAGILIEASGNTQNCRAVIGVGINWDISDELLKTVDQSCMNIAIKSVSREKFIIKLIENIESYLKEFEKNGLLNIKQKWNAHDGFLNQKIELITGKKSIIGEYLGINESGMLMVKHNNTINTHASGEVSLRKVD